MKNKKVDKDICLCPDCQGSGKVLERTSAYESETVKCKTCLGSGRLLVITTKEFKPYAN